MNSVALIGRLPTDPDINAADGGFRVAVLVSTLNIEEVTDMEPTRAEARVLDYVARGKTNKEIAARSSSRWPL